MSNTDQVSLREIKHIQSFSKKSTNLDESSASTNVRSSKDTVRLVSNLFGSKLFSIIYVQMCHSPVSLLAEVFMDDIEKSILKHPFINGFLYWFRYFDDISGYVSVELTDN